MDPNATLNAWLNDPNHTRNRERTGDFNAWIQSGGFSPTVEIAPHADMFMRGDRWGQVTKLGDKYAWIKGNRSGRTFRLTRDSIARVVGEPF